MSPRRASADLAEAEDTASGCFLGELWCSLEGTADREIPGDVMMVVVVVVVVMVVMVVVVMEMIMMTVINSFICWQVCC